MENFEDFLTRDEKKKLLKIARETISAYIRRETVPKYTIDTPNFLRRNGAFVTLKKNGLLRGCIGTFEGGENLIETIQEMAISAATRDPRFPSLKISELPDIKIEITILSDLIKIDDINKIEIGKHGIYITKGFYRGVLLPQVATEYGWDRIEFLKETCIKAGLDPDEWQNPETNIEIFSAIIFGEDDFMEH